MPTSSPVSDVVSDVMPFFTRLEGEWKGNGINHDNQHYDARMVVDVPFNEAALSLLFSATGVDGTLYHREMLMVGRDETGAAIAFSASNNLPGLVRFSATRPSADVAVLTLGEGEDLSSFREIITFELKAEGSLIHGFAWGMPGAPVEDKSSAHLIRV